MKKNVENCCIESKEYIIFTSSNNNKTHTTMEKLIKLTKEQIRVENAIEKIESMIQSGKGDYETLKEELYAKYNMLSKIKDAIIAF